MCLRKEHDIHHLFSLSSSSLSFSLLFICQWHGKYVRHSWACKSMNIISYGSNSIGRRRQCHTDEQIDCVHTQVASVSVRSHAVPCCSRRRCHWEFIVFSVQIQHNSCCYSLFDSFDKLCEWLCLAFGTWLWLRTSILHTHTLLLLYLQEMTLILRRTSQCMSMTNANMRWKNKENCDAWSHMIDDCHRRISIHILSTSTHASSNENAFICFSEINRKFVYSQSS